MLEFRQGLDVVRRRPDTSAKILYDTSLAAKEGFVHSGRIGEGRTKYWGKKTIQLFRRQCADPLAVDEIKQFGGGAAGFLEALFPLLDRGFADTEEGGEHALADMCRGSDALNVRGGETALGRQAKAVELPHGHVIHVAFVVKAFRGGVDILEDPAHDAISNRSPSATIFARVTSS